MKNHQECIKLRRHLMSYIDGDLDINSFEELEKHIEKCMDCQINVVTLRKTIELCKKSALNYQFPDDIRDRLYRWLDMGEYL